MLNSSKVSYLPFHSCTEQSPVCLIPAHEGPCLHKNCLLAYKNPQWLGISISEFYNQEEFSQFDVRINSDSRLTGHEHIIPRNPNPGAKDGFEGFRQSMNAILNIAGNWPVGIKIAERQHVVIRWTEFIDQHPYTDPVTFKTTWHYRLNVEEHAYYTGPINGPMINYDPTAEKGGASC